jgi:hypothetical protein
MVGRGQEGGQVGDSVVFRTRLHPVSVVAGLFGTILTVLFTILMLRNNALSGRVGLETALGGSLIGLAWLLGPLWRFVRSDIQVARDSVVVQKSVFRGPQSARLGDIEDVVAYEGTFGRYFGYGTVALYGRNSTGTTLRHVRDATGLRDAINRQRRRR